jgi:hypothetical protein
MLIVRDAALQDVPFEMLVVQGRPLGARHSVSYAASLGDFVQLRIALPPSSSANQRPLAIGLAAAALIIAVAGLRKRP